MVYISTEAEESLYLKVFKKNLHEFLKNIMSIFGRISMKAQVHLIIAWAPWALAKHLNGPNALNVVPRSSGPAFLQN